MRPIQSSILQYMYSPGPLHSIGFGVKHSWDMGELEALSFLNQGEARIKLGSASNASAFIADAWRFGAMGLELAVGASHQALWPGGTHQVFRPAGSRA